MVPNQEPGNGALERFPRPRGDGPLRTRLRFPLQQVSPPARGWSQQAPCSRLDQERFPRPRGDGPFERLSVKERLDYQSTLSKQFPVSALRVVYNRGGMHLVAATISDHRGIGCKWPLLGDCQVAQEAHYLCAIITRSNDAAVNKTAFVRKRCPAPTFRSVQLRAVA